MADSAHDRSEERKELKARFMAGASLLMLAPRRIGKTWLMDKVMTDMIDEGWLCFKIDAQGMRSETEFLRALCQQIEEGQQLTKRVIAHIKQRFKTLSSNIEDGNLAAALGQVDPREFLETLVGSLNREEEDTLILVDEIALFVLKLAKTSPDEAESLLYHLRKLQLAYPKVRWFLTGSIGLDVVARRHNMLGTLHDLDSYPLEPFSPEAAWSYLRHLCDSAQVARPFNLNQQSFDHLVRELGWLSPYYLRQIALQMRPTGGGTSEIPLATIDDVDQAFARLLSPSQRMHFAAWEEHIDKNFEDGETRQLAAILNILCAHSDGEIEVTILTLLTQIGTPPSQSALRELLRCLQTDGFLEKNGDRWAFRSGLLRRYWKEYQAYD